MKDNNSNNSRHNLLKTIAAGIAVQSMQVNRFLRRSTCKLKTL
jgi:hypothetical protein